MNCVKHGWYVGKRCDHCVIARQQTRIGDGTNVRGRPRKGERAPCDTMRAAQWGVFLKGKPVDELQGLTEERARGLASLLANYPDQFEARKT